VPDPRYRVLAVATHPVQYMAPIFRRMATHPALDLQVAYCTLRGAEAAHDPEFGANIQWDVPLLDGYSWSQVPNRGSGAESYFGLFNPGLWNLIHSGNFDAVLSFTGYRNVTFWLSRIAAKLSRTAFLFGTDATTLAPRDGRMWKTTIKRILWPRLFRLADQVIVPSSGSLDLMLSLGLPAERVTLTPYSVDNDWWIRHSARVDCGAVRARWGPQRTMLSSCSVPNFNPGSIRLISCMLLQRQIFRKHSWSSPEKALFVRSLNRKQPLLAFLREFAFLVSSISPNSQRSTPPPISWFCLLITNPSRLS